MPACDRVAKTYVDEVGGPDIAYRREARFERPFRVQRCVVRLLDRKAQQLIVEAFVEVLLHLTVEVDVRVDETRQERRVAQVDDSCIGGSGAAPMEMILSPRTRMEALCASRPDRASNNRVAFSK